jgi:hypothetical protein
LSFKRTVFLLTMLAVFTMAMRVSVDSDTWWHLRAGKTITEQRAVLDHDPFSLTRQGEEWKYPGWLAEVFIYGAFSALGLPGLNLLTALAVAAAFLMLWPLMEGQLLLRSVILLLAATTSAVYWSARPQIFSFTLTAAFLLILERERRSESRLLWLLPVLMTVWGNLHGGFVIGFILIALYLAGWVVTIVLKWNQEGQSLRTLWFEYRGRILRLTGVGLLSAVFIGFNPHGYTMLAYPFKTVSIGVLRSYIQEWQSPDFHQLQVLPFLAMMILNLVAFGNTKRAIEPVEMLSALTFNTMALLASRNIALYALVDAPILVRHLDSMLARIRWSKRSSRQIPHKIARMINVLLVLVLLIPAIIKIMIPLAPKTNAEAVRELYPQAAVEYILGSDVPGPIFNSYNWGAYVIWELYPRYLSFVDGRTDLFDDDVLEQYLSVWRGDDEWQGVLDQWGIATVMIEPQAPLRLRLEANMDWSKIYQDQQAVIFTRQDARE